MKCRIWTEKKRLLIGGGAALGIVIGAVLLMPRVLGIGSQAHKQLLYIKDGQLYYTKNMEKEEAMGIAEMEWASSEPDNNAQYIRLNSSQDWAYYFSEMDESHYGTLCRIELSKLGNNEVQNERSIEEIDTNVAGDYHILKNNGVIYKRENNKLYYRTADDKEREIAKDVFGFSLSEDEKYVLYLIYEDEDAIISYYDIATGESGEIVSGDIYTDDLKNPDFIPYIKSGDEETVELHKTNLKGKHEKIADHITNIIEWDSEKKTIYYVEAETEERSLYEFIEDPYASQDAPLKLPEIKNYLIESTEKEAVSENDYEWYFASDAQGKQEFYDYYMDDDNETGMKYYYKKYGNDENGYEDEIYFYDENQEKWYFLDLVSYMESYDKYNSVSSRMQLREELQKETINQTVYNLCYYEEGKEVRYLVEGSSSDAYEVLPELEFITFEKVREEESKIHIDEITSVYSVASEIESLLQGNLEDTSYYYQIGEGSPVEMDGSVYDLQLSQDKSQLVMEYTNEDFDRKFVCYEVEGDQLSEGKEIDEEMMALGQWINNAYYYFIGDGSDTEVDLYKWVKGEKEKVLSDVYPYNITYQEDERLVAYRDYTSEEGGQLRVYDEKGEYVKVGSEVSDYTYIDTNYILYNKEGDLYLFDGGEEHKKIARDVEDYVCFPVVDYIPIF